MSLRNRSVAAAWMPPAAGIFRRSGSVGDGCGEGSATSFAGRASMMATNRPPVLGDGTALVTAARRLVLTRFTASLVNESAARGAGFPASY
jgi:hypothetical protein